MLRYHVFGLALLGCLTSLSTVRADLLVFGSDTKKSTELSDLVTKNAAAKGAIEAFERNDIPTCEYLLKEAVKDAKDLPAVDVMIARLLMARGQFNEALSRLESFLTTTNKDAEAHATMGEIAFLNGRMTDAWLQFKEALALISDPSSTFSKPRKTAFINQLTRLRAETAERRRDLVTADNLYKELEKALPEAGYPLLAQGRLLIAKGEITKGAELLTKARALDDSIPQPELQIAIVLASGTDDKETENWFQKGIKNTKTETVQNWSEYMKWLLIKDRPEDVQTLISRTEKYKNHRFLRMLDALALRYLGKLDEAERALSALHSENTDDLEATDQLALVLVESLDQGKKLRAQQLSQVNLQRAPNEEGAIATAAWVEYRLGNVPVANQYLSALVNRGTSNPQTMYYVGKLLESRGGQAQAMGLYQAAVNSPGLFIQRKEMKAIVDKAAKEAAAAAAAGKAKTPPAAGRSNEEKAAKNEKQKDEKTAASGKSPVNPNVKEPDSSTKKEPSGATEKEPAGSAKKGSTTPSTKGSITPSTKDSTSPPGKSPAEPNKGSPK